VNVLPIDPDNNGFFPRCTQGSMWWIAFTNTLISESEIINKIISQQIPLKAMTDDERRQYRAATKCANCNCSFHVGGGYYISVTSGLQCVDLRRFYMMDGKLILTREGVALRLYEWADLCTLIPTITEGNSKLGTAVPCYMEQDHQDQLKTLNCKECNPFGPGVVFLDELVGESKAAPAAAAAD